MRHPDRDDLVGFLLGALEPERDRQVEDHIEGCKSCAAEASHFAPAVGVLAESVEQVEPPPELRAALMAAVEREAGQAHAAPAGELGGLRRGRLSGWLMRPATALAAVALAVAGLGGYLIAEDGDEGGDSTTVAVNSMLPDAGGELVVRGGEATLNVHGMPPLESNHAVYQVWVSDGETVRPSASFVPHADGTATAAVPEAADGATQVMVTREPRPGREQPTLPTVLEVELS
jgi:hypothetical protein